MLDKLFLALRAGDGNFAFALGYAHLLVATGAIIIAVFLILQFLEEQQEFPVFLVTLIDIPGQRTANGQNHETIRYSGENHLYRSHRNQHGQEGKAKTCTQNRHIQFICAVSTCHELPQTHTQLSEKSVHILLLGGNLSYIIVKNMINSTLKCYI